MRGEGSQPVRELEDLDAFLDRRVIYIYRERGEGEGSRERERVCVCERERRERRERERRSSKPVRELEDLDAFLEAVPHDVLFS